MTGTEGPSIPQPATAAEPPSAPIKADQAVISPPADLPDQKLPDDQTVAEATSAPERTKTRRLKEIKYTGTAVAAQTGKHALDEVNATSGDARQQFMQDPTNRLRVLLYDYAARDYLPPDDTLNYTNSDNTPYQLQVDHEGQAYHVTTITGIKIGEAGAPDIFTVKLENKAEPVEIPRTALVGAFLNQFLDKIAPTLPPEQAKMLRLYQAVLNNEAADLPPDTDTTLVESANQSGLITADHLKGFVGKLLPQKTVPADAKPEERTATEATNAENAQKTAAVEKALAGVRVIDYDDMAAFCDVLGVNTGNVAVLIADAQTRVQQRESYIQTDGFSKKPEEAKIQIRHELAQAQAEAEVYEQAGNALHEGNAFGEFFYRQAHGDVTPEQGKALATSLENGDTEPLLEFALTSYEKAIGAKVTNADAREKLKQDWKKRLGNTGTYAGLGVLFLFMTVLTGNKPKQGQ